SLDTPLRHIFCLPQQTPPNKCVCSFSASLPYTKPLSFVCRISTNSGSYFKMETFFWLLAKQKPMQK
ncbi:MAG: hypothetical protein KIC77_00790, partial [Clostridiales bacterium]|nr:hypothetical protein [Clostridiales bacterium]